MTAKNLIPEIIRPNWSVAASVQALSTTRKGGVSQSPWNELNLANHVNDNQDDVLQNRRLLKQHCGLPDEPVWLEQIHSNKVVSLTAQNSKLHFKADASYTTEKNIVCCVMTADCLPVIFCNKQATWVAAAHAGWKGIANGILKKLLDIFCREMQGNLSDLQVWIGPAISGQAYEVAEEVKNAYLQQDSNLEQAFTAQKNGRFLLDNSLAAQLQLTKKGLLASQIATEAFCTFQDKQRFYSYRRDGLNSGRMASMIWLA